MKCSIIWTSCSRWDFRLRIKWTPLRILSQVFKARPKKILLRLKPKWDEEDHPHLLGNNILKIPLGSPRTRQRMVLTPRNTVPNTINNKMLIVAISWILSHSFKVKSSLKRLVIMRDTRDRYIHTRLIFNSQTLSSCRTLSFHQGISLTIMDNNDLIT